MSTSLKKAGLIFLFLAFLAQSCFYMDTDIHRVDLFPTVYPKVSISSNLDDLDSIRLYDSLFFKYEVSIDTGQIYFTELYLGGNFIFSSDTLVDSLWIKPYFLLENGDYALSLAVYYKTVSGSLADLLNAEFYYTDTTWALTLEREFLP